MRTILDITRRHDVTFFPSGKIDITARVARIMELQRGDVIDIAIDGDEYYLFVRHRAQNVVGCHQATVWPTKERSHNFRCYSRRLCNAMLRTQSTGSEERSVYLPGILSIMRNMEQ